MNNLNKATDLFVEILEIEASKASAAIRGEDSWDSLRHLTLVTTLEDELGLRFSMDEIEAIENLSDLHALISAKS